jgi:hypothetical protein
MSRKSNRVAIFAIIAVLLMGCMSYNEKIQSYIDDGYVTTQSMHGSIEKGAKIGVIPFESTAPLIGASVSDFTVKGMSDLGFVFVDSFDLTELLKKKSAYYYGLVKDKEYERIITLAELDYLMVGKVTTLTSNKIVTAVTHIVDTNGNVVLKATFAPPKGRWKAQEAGTLLAEAIKNELK